jgi:prepilin-type processing-associated H-X9-DG protein
MAGCGSDAPSASVAPLIKYLPGDADVYVTIDMAGLRQTDLWKQADVEQKMADTPVALEPEDLVGFAVAIKLPPPAQGMSGPPAAGFAVTVANDIGPDTLLKGEGMKLEKVSDEGDEPIYMMAGEPGSPDTGYVAFPTARTILVSTTEDGVKAMLGRPGTASEVKHLQRIFAESGVLHVAVRVPTEYRQKAAMAAAGLDRMMPGLSAPLKPVLEGLGDLESAAVAYDPKRTEAVLRILVDWGGPETASKAAEALVKAAPEAVKQVRQNLGAEAEGDLYTAAADGSVLRIDVPASTMKLIEAATEKARGAAQAAASQTNLQQIAMAAMMYANSHDGRLPESLQALVADGTVLAAIPENPALPSRVPGGDYRLVPLGSVARVGRAAPEDILAYEVFPRDYTPPDGTVGVAFADGHVERLPVAEFKERLAATKQKYGLP